MRQVIVLYFKDKAIAIKRHRATSARLQKAGVRVRAGWLSSFLPCLVDDILATAQVVFLYFFGSPQQQSI